MEIRTETGSRVPEKPLRRLSWVVVVVGAVGFVLSYLVARVLLAYDGLPVGYRVAAALLPVPPFALVLWCIIRGVRQMDELQQRIQLEALAVAFPLVLLLLLTLGLMELAVPLPPEDLSYRHVWAMVPTLYLAGLVWATRRYK